MSAIPYNNSSSEFTQGTLQAFKLMDIMPSSTDMSTGCANLLTGGLINLKQQEKLMKLIKNLAGALLLASVLSVNVYAGDQHTPGYVPPPPPPATCPAEDTECTETTTQLAETQEPTFAEELWSDALVALLSFY
jgi:hypothetical protein